MVAIKGLAQIAEKYVRRASAAQGDYQSAVQATPPTLWETNAKAAASSWSQGVAAAAADGRFASGIDGKGAKWLRKATTVGPQRYQTGVAAASGDYSTGFSRFHDVIAALNLGPRGPRGDQRNYARSNLVGDAQHTARLAMKKGA